MQVVIENLYINESKGTAMDMKEFFIDEPDEQPLDHMAVDGGYCGILRTVACVGASLDSGEMEVFDAENKRYCIDKFEYSWLSYFARFTGNEVRHFTRGGMSTKEYVESFADSKDFWDRKKACHAYVITLGGNDVSLMLRGNLEFGSIDDIDLNDYRNNKKTFVGYYGTIIQRYREISPKCRIFLAICFQPKTEERLPLLLKHQQLLYQLAEMFEFTYVMDLLKYGPVVDDAFMKKFYMNGHMTPAGYLLKGRLFTSYMDYIIRHHLDDFAQIAMLGDTIHDPRYVW